MPRAIRLTRTEQKQLTRQRLLNAAEELFVSLGIAGTSIEDIAETAGFSRGAFYSNFSDKHALVLELMRNTAERDNAHLGRLLNQRTSTADFLNAMRTRELDTTRSALQREFHLYALRNIDARPDLVAINRTSRQTTERFVHEIWQEIEFPVPITAQFASRVLQCLDDGIATLRITEPEEFPPGMYTDVLMLLHEALIALAEKRNSA